MSWCEDQKHKNGKKKAGQVGQFLKKVRMRQKYRDMKKLKRS